MGTSRYVNWLVFSKPASPEKRALDDLIDADRVALVGPIVAEVLFGFRRKAQCALGGLTAPGGSRTWDDWKLAAEIGRELAAKGHAIPISDLVIAAVAKRIDAGVYSTDPHFDLIPELKRYHPPS